MCQLMANLAPVSRRKATDCLLVRVTPHKFLPRWNVGEMSFFKWIKFSVWTVILYWTNTGLLKITTIRVESDYYLSKFNHESFDSRQNKTTQWLVKRNVKPSDDKTLSIKGNENYTEFLSGRIFYVWLFTLA